MEELLGLAAAHSLEATEDLQEALGPVAGSQVQQAAEGDRAGPGRVDRRLGS